MKQRIILLFLIMLIIGSCVEREQYSTDQQQIESITAKIADFSDFYFDEDPATKTGLTPDEKFYWAANDTLGIFPAEGSQVYFVVTDGSGTNSANFTGGGWGLKTGNTYYSYYPLVGQFYLDKNRIPVSYEGQKQVGTTNFSHIGPFDFMYAPGVVPESSALNFTYYHLNSYLRLTVTLPADEYICLRITTTENVLVKKGYYDLTADQPAVIPVEYTNQLSVDLEDIVLAEAGTFKIYMMLAPVDLNGKQVTVSVLNKEKKELQCVKTPSRAYDAGSIYGLTCPSSGDTWTEIPQTVGFSMNGWDTGDNIGGTVE